MHQDYVKLLEDSGICLLISKNEIDLCGIDAIRLCRIVKRLRVNCITDM